MIWAKQTIHKKNITRNSASRLATLRNRVFFDWIADPFTESVVSPVYDKLDKPYFFLHQGGKPAWKYY